MEKRTGGNQSARAQEKIMRKERASVQKDYKDTLFRMIFREKRALLSLYNAVNGTDYTDENELEIVTLENAIYMNVKNDLAFVIDDCLNLYEHQSTPCPNMPLRDLIYITKELQGRVEMNQLYRRKLVKIPTPRFLVFYNGTEQQPERQILRLSDAYIQPMEEPELELVVTMLNINIEKNQELLDRCRLLKEYMLYVQRVRKYAREMELKEAVEQAVQECIQENILRDFLNKNRNEAISVCLSEYNEELVMQYLKEDFREEGLREGREEGRKEGFRQGELRKLAELVAKKRKKGKSPEVIAEELEEELSEIMPVYQALEAWEETCDLEEICHRLIRQSY